MLYNKTSNFISLYKKHSYLFLLLFLSFSCTDPLEKNNSPAAYNRAIDSANLMYDAGNPQRAIHYLDSTTEKYRNISITQKFSYYLINYNFYYHKKNDKNRASLYADSMLNLFNTPEKKLKYTAQFGQCYFFKGDILFDENKYEEAYQNYYQGKIIANNSLNDCTMGDYSYRMGMIMYKQEHYQPAADYFKVASQQTGSCNWTFRSFYRRQELLNNTGLSYSKINKTDSAMLYYKKAIDYINAFGPQFHQDNLIDVALGVVYGDEANIYISNKDYKSAEGLLKKSIAINLRKGNDNRDAQLSELKLAHLYSEENKPDSLIGLLQSVSGQFDSIKNQEAEADWNMLMANYLLKKNDAASAFNYLLKHDILKDSITNATKKLKESDIFQQIEKLQKDYDLAKLQQNNKLQRIYLAITIVFGFMLVAIISLVYRNWQRSNRNLRTLGTLNDQINYQNQNLEQALSELNSSSQEKDRILRTVAHDLRNPLGGVASLTNLMFEESEYTPEQKELINLIRETSNNSLELINDILEATDNISARLSKEKELIEINSLLANSIELMRFKAAEKRQEIIFHNHDLSIALLVHREQIWRVISNLISNAIKFSPEMGLIQVRLIDGEKTVEISVADNGIGIPDGMGDEIFNMFTEAKRPGTSGEKSFGLGLSICRQIINNHDGKIWFENNGEQGTVFYVSLNKAADSPAIL